MCLDFAKGYCSSFVNYINLFGYNGRLPKYSNLNTCRLQKFRSRLAQIARCMSVAILICRYLPGYMQVEPWAGMEPWAVMNEPSNSPHQPDPAFLAQVQGLKSELENFSPSIGQTALDVKQSGTNTLPSLQILIYPCRQLQLKLIIYIFRRLLLVQNLKGLPVLVAAGAEDILVPLKSAHVLATKIANSTLIPISGCGHLPHEECPKALLAALIPFVSRLHKISQKA